MTTAKNPFNFTITDQSPLFRYLPFRDGPLESSWNVTYTQNTDSSWVADTFIGQGKSSHRTALKDATAQLTWTGTAIYLYGDALPGSYSVQIDGLQSDGIVNASGPEALLFSRSQLPYQQHSMIFRVLSGPVAISYATVTTGMGDVGTTVQNRTIKFANTPPPIPGIVMSDGWTVQPNTYSTTNMLYPRIGTTTQGSYLSFPLNSTTGFSIFGSVNYNHGAYSVSVFPPSDLGPPQMTQFNGSSRWIGLDAMLYLQTGMDRSREYRIQITNDAPDQWLDVASIQLYDTPSLSSSSSQPQNGLKAAAIVGIALGCFFFLLFVLIAFVCFRRRHRQPPDAGFEVDQSSQREMAPSYFMPTPFVSPGGLPSRDSFSHAHPESPLRSGTPVNDSTSHFTPVPFPAHPYTDSHSPSSAPRLSDAADNPPLHPKLRRAAAQSAPSPTPSHSQAADSSPVIVHQDIADRVPVELPPQYSESRTPLIFLESSNGQASPAQQDFGS